MAIHHHQLLGSSLEDAAALLLECLHGGGDPAVGQAAAMALLDLFISFGSAVLRVLERQQQEPQHSCLLGLLMAAALGRTPAIRHWANEALRCVCGGGGAWLLKVCGEEPAWLGGRIAKGPHAPAEQGIPKC